MRPLPSVSLTQTARNLSLPGWLFTLSVIGFLLARRLLREGLFGDGLTYASIARNMAEGRGTFWQPFFSSSFWLPYNRTTVFYDHPPLMFGLQAQLFRWLGDTPYTEKIYCGGVIVLTAVLMLQLWRRLLPGRHPLRAWGWLPLLCWYSFRTAEWCNAQNLLDGTMSLFCLAAVWAMLNCFSEPRRAFAGVLAAILALLAAFLTKGPVSLHVLAVPMLYAIFIHRAVGPALAWTVALTVGWALALGAVLLHEPAREFMRTYAGQQIWAALKGRRESLTTEYASGRFFVIQMLLQNVAPGLVTGLVLRVAAAKTSFRRPELTLNRVAWFWTALTLAAVLPMMVSTKQYEHYIVPALPYAALGLAAWLGPRLLHLASLPQKLPVRTLTVLTAVLLAGVGLYGIRIVGSAYPRDRHIVDDTHRLGQHIPSFSRVGVPPSLMGNMIPHTYLQRYHRIELAPLHSRPRFALAERNRPGDSLAVRSLGYQPLAAFHYFVLYRRSDVSSAAR